MRTAAKTTAMVVASILLAGCAAATRSGAATSSSPPRADGTSSSSSSPRIPDGTWSREVTTAEISRRGLRISPDVITANYLDDGSVRLVLKTQGSRWSILVEDDKGAFEVGDQGGTSYDAQGRWVQASDSTGDSILLGWAVSGDTLTTSVPTTTPGRRPTDDERLFVEGAWRHQG